MNKQTDTVSPLLDIFPNQQDDPIWGYVAMSEGGAIHLAKALQKLGRKLSAHPYLLEPTSLGLWAVVFDNPRLTKENQ